MLSRVDHDADVQGASTWRTTTAVRKAGLSERFSGHPLKTGEAPYLHSHLHEERLLFGATATNAVLRVGRELSSWLVDNVPALSSPSVPSFLSNDSSTTRQPSSTNVSSPVLPPTTPFVNELPQELLEEIFREYLHGSTSTTFSGKHPLEGKGSWSRIVTCPAAKTTPFTLAHVCSSWRAIVMSNPSLWSKICAFRAEPQDIPLFQFWMSLSGTCPLDLSLFEAGRDEMENMDMTAHCLLLAALKHSDRWKRVSLRLSEDMEAVFREDSNLPIPTMSSLQSFDIVLHKWTPEGSRALGRLFSSSPVLQGVTFGAMCEIPHFIPEVSWANIRAVRIAEICLSDLMSILLLSPSLESLYVRWFSGTRTNQRLPDANHPILLPSLTTITFISYGDASALFDRVTLPALSSLSLQSGLDPVLDPGWASLSNLVQRSSCHIQALYLSDSSLGRSAEDNIIDNVKKLPTSVFSDVTHLELGSPMGTKAVESLILHPGDDYQLFPSLKSLEMTNCKSSASSECLHTMIASRRPQLQMAEIVVYDDRGYSKSVIV